MEQDWNAEEVLERLLKRSMKSKSSMEPNLRGVHSYDEHKAIPISELESVVVKVAHIVDELGESYIDVFERAEKELKKARHAQAVMACIRDLVKQNP